MKKFVCEMTISILVAGCAVAKSESVPADQHSVIGTWQGCSNVPSTRMYRSSKYEFKADNELVETIEFSLDAQCATAGFRSITHAAYEIKKQMAGIGYLVHFKNFAKSTQVFLDSETLAAVRGAQDTSSVKIGEAKEFGIGSELGRAVVGKVFDNTEYSIYSITNGELYSSRERSQHSVSSTTFTLPHYAPTEIGQCIEDNLCFYHVDEVPETLRGSDKSQIYRHVATRLTYPTEPTGLKKQ